VRYATDFSVDAVLCGHIHSASIRQLQNVEYYNCGDWVESCTALVEHHDGKIELVTYPAFPTEAAPTNLTALSSQVCLTTSE
jgi:UDP-2,3-diacylglucosamine pyrophosphatase LpxH